jgi:hypothetical protein
VPPCPQVSHYSLLPEKRARKDAYPYLGRPKLEQWDYIFAGLTRPAPRRFWINIHPGFPTELHNTLHCASDEKSTRSACSLFHSFPPCLSLILFKAWPPFTGRAALDSPHYIHPPRKWIMLIIFTSSYSSRAPHQHPGFTTGLYVYSILTHAMRRAQRKQT